MHFFALNFKLSTKMKRIILPMLFLASLISCENDAKSSNETTSVVLANQSATPVLLKKQAGFENLELFSLILPMMFWQEARILFLEVLPMDQDY